MPIELIPAGADIEEVVAELHTTEITTETPEETLPIKRGRGRPKGSLNKPKPVRHDPVPPPEEAEEPRAEEPQEEPEKPESESEEEEPTPPPKVKRRPPPVVVAKAKATPKRQPRVRAATPSPPETPRSRKTRVLGEYRQYRVNQHAERQNHFTSMLNRFMH